MKALIGWERWKVSLPCSLHLQDASPPLNAGALRMPGSVALTLSERVGISLLHSYKTEQLVSRHTKSLAEWMELRFLPWFAVAQVQHLSKNSALL